MKNAYTPAIPVMNGDGEAANFEHEYYKNRSLATGLTKREMMAMNAPEMPDWFIGVWRSRNNIQPGFSVSSASMIRIYFEWNVYFADQLLIELDRAGGESK